MSDESSNPQTPVYTKARPVINEGCINCGATNNNDFYNPATVGKTAEVLAGVEIAVDDLSDSAVDRFRVNVDLTEQLVVTLTLIPYISTNIQTLPILKGNSVDRIKATWVYSEAIVTQNLQNTGGLSVPTLNAADREEDYTGIAVTDNISLTITGNTGEGFVPESIGADTKSVTFGNYLAFGAGVSLGGLSLATVQTYYDSFIGLGNTEIRTNRNATVYNIGGQGEKSFIMYPKSWGLASFTKGIWTGGWYRVKNVAGTLKLTLAGGDTETDIILDNGTGFTEAYYIYETFDDFKGDAITPTILS